MRSVLLYMSALTTKSHLKACFSHQFLILSRICHVKKIVLNVQFLMDKVTYVMYMTIVATMTKIKKWCEKWLRILETII